MFYVLIIFCSRTNTTVAWGCSLSHSHPCEALSRCRPALHERRADRAAQPGAMGAPSYVHPDHWDQAADGTDCAAARSQVAADRPLYAQSSRPLLHTRAQDKPLSAFTMEASCGQTNVCPQRVCVCVRGCDTDVPGCFFFSTDIVNAAQTVEKKKIIIQIPRKWSRVSSISSEILCFSMNTENMIEINTLIQL